MNDKHTKIKLKKICLIVGAILLIQMLVPILTNVELTSKVSAETQTWGDYKYQVLEDGTIEIAKYTGSAKELNIPSKINGKSVTRLGHGAFFGCSSTSITIPNGVTRIDSYVFEGCRSLTNITIPSSVTSIGYNPFLYCSNLNNIIVDTNNNSYKSIDGILYTKDEKELIACPGNKKGNITIPSSVTRIIYVAFGGCSNLNNIIVDKKNNSYKSIDGILYTKDEKELIACPANKIGNITIPSSVTRIGDGAFENCSSLTNITIPNSVTSIGSYAFECCSSLTNITIPNSVTSIDYRAFRSCSSLTNITIPNSVTSIGPWIFEYANIKIYYNSKKNEVELPDIIKKAKTEGDVLYSPDQKFEKIEGGDSFEIVGDKVKIKSVASKRSFKVVDGKLDGLYVDIIEDNAPPSISVSKSTNKWVTDSITVTVKAKDTGIGLAEKPYSFDGGNTWQASNKKTFTQYQKNVVIKVKDKLENTKTYTIDEIKIDQEPPKVTIKGNSTTWINKNVKITVDATDTKSGLAEKPYSFNGGEWTSEKTITVDKNQQINIKVKDKLGNITEKNVNVTKIDKEMPTLKGVTKSTENLTKGNVVLTVEAEDSISGLAEQAYSFDGGKTWQSKNKYTFTENKTGIIVIVKDKAGNTKSSSVINITNIDKKMPTINTVSVNPLESGIGYERVLSSQGITYNDYRLSPAEYANKEFLGGTMKEKGCGLIATSTILSGYGIEKNPSDVLEYMKSKNVTEVNGDNLLSIFRNEGINSIKYTYDDQAKARIENSFLKKNKPVLIQTGLNQSGEWICLLGIDKNNQVIVSNPVIKNMRKYNLEDLLKYCRVKEGYSYIVMVDTPTGAKVPEATLTVSASDEGFGLAEKPYSFDGGKTWQAGNSKKYTQNTSGILVKVKDKVGNITTYDREINIQNVYSKLTTSGVVYGAKAKKINGQNARLAKIYLGRGNVQVTSEDETEWNVVFNDNEKNKETYPYYAYAYYKANTNGDGIKVTIKDNVTQEIVEKNVKITGLDNTLPSLEANFGQSGILYEKLEDGKKVKVTVKANKELKEIEDVETEGFGEKWQIDSQDKTKAYVIVSENKIGKVMLVDKAENKSQVEINVNQINTGMNASVTYKVNNTSIKKGQKTNQSVDVTVRVDAIVNIVADDKGEEEKLKWIRTVEDGKTYFTKKYENTTNGLYKEELKVEDVTNPNVWRTVTPGVNIDKQKPTLQIKTKTVKEDKVIVKLKASEKVTIKQGTGWKLDAEGKLLTKTFKANTEAEGEKVKVQDIVGNESDEFAVKVTEIGMQVTQVDENTKLKSTNAKVEKERTDGANKTKVSIPVNKKNVTVKTNENNSVVTGRLELVRLASRGNGIRVATKGNEQNLENDLNGDPEEGSNSEINEDEDLNWHIAINTEEETKEEYPYYIYKYFDSNTGNEGIEVEIEDNVSGDKTQETITITDIDNEKPVKDQTFGTNGILYETLENGKKVKVTVKANKELKQVQDVSLNENWQIDEEDRTKAYVIIEEDKKGEINLIDENDNVSENIEISVNQISEYINVAKRYFVNGEQIKQGKRTNQSVDVDIKVDEEIEIIKDVNIVNGSEEIAQDITKWIINGNSQEEGKTYLNKTYEEDTNGIFTEELTIRNKNNNSTRTITLKIYIDKHKPVLVETERIVVEDTVKVTLQTNEKALIKQAPEGWTLDEEGKTLTKTFTQNTEEAGEKIIVKDLAGNESEEKAVLVSTIGEEKPEDSKLIVEDTTYSTEEVTQEPVEVTVNVNKSVEIVESDKGEEEKNKWQIVEQEDGSVNLVKTYSENTIEEITVKESDSGDIAEQNEKHTEKITINVNNIDKVKPVAEVSNVPEKWTKEDVTLEVNVEENTLELAEKPYSFDGGNTWQEENTKEFTQYAENIEILVKDKAGNISEKVFIDKIKIDKEIPTVTVGKIEQEEENKLKVVLKANKKIENIEALEEALNENDKIESYELSEDGTELIIIYVNKTNKEINIRDKIIIKDEAENEKEVNLAEEEIELKAMIEIIGKLLGDIDNNNVIDISDLLLMKRHVLAGEDFDLLLEDDEQADMDEDGNVNITDLLLLKRKMLNVE